MKIGILTFHSVDNYGAVLQAFALQTYLASLGHEVEMIDYRPAYFHAARKLPITHPMRLIGELVGRYHGHKFETFRRRYMKRTAACLTTDDLEAKLPQYDAVIVGSDQVWSPNVDRRKETDPIFFFRWNLPKETKKIGYAASFGTDSIPDEHVEAVREGLANIDVISVREKSGVAIVKEIANREATWVCDPVFLLTPEQWQKACGYQGQKDVSYLTYMPPATDIMQSLASLVGVKVNHTMWSPYYLLKRGLGQTLPAPLEWVKKIASSRGFVTKSFHGTSFAILMHTPFVYICPGGAAAKRATRILSVLERVGLLDRVLLEEEASAERIFALFASPIDWERGDAARVAYVGESQNFLQDSLRHHCLV